MALHSALLAWGRRELRRLILAEGARARGGSFERRVHRLLVHEAPEAKKAPDIGAALPAKPRREAAELHR